MFRWMWCKIKKMFVAIGNMIKKTVKVTIKTVKTMLTEVATWSSVPENRATVWKAAKGPIKKVEEIVIDSLMRRGMAYGEALGFIFRIREFGAKGYG